MGYDYWLRRLKERGPWGWVLDASDSELVLGPGRCIPDNDNMPLRVLQPKRHSRWVQRLQSYRRVIFMVRSQAK